MLIQKADDFDVQDKSNKAVFENLERPLKEKETQIAEQFTQEMEAFYETKAAKMKQREDKSGKLAEQEKLIVRLIRNQAAQYINNRKRRFEQEVPTLNEFLRTVYREISTSYKEATEKNFPFNHMGFGAKARENKSFIFSLNLRKIFSPFFEKILFYNSEIIFQEE